MKANVILAQNQNGDIQRCCHGIVHVYLKNGVSLRFREDAFLNFASMVKEASSQLMDETVMDLLSGKN